MKLLENVLWDIENKKAVKWRSENESFYNLPDSPYPHRISKLGARPLTTEEKAHYLYDLCCKPHSRFGDFADLCDFIDKDAFVPLCVCSRHDAHIDTILNCIRRKLKTYETA